MNDTGNNRNQKLPPNFVHKIAGTAVLGHFQCHLFPVSVVLVSVLYSDLLQKMVRHLFINDSMFQVTDLLVVQLCPTIIVCMFDT